MNFKLLFIPFIIFFIAILVLLFFQFIKKKNYINNLFISFFVGIFFLIIFNMINIESRFVYSIAVYISLFYLLANFFQQNKSGIQLGFLKKIYFSRNKKIKVNKLYSKNFEKEKFNTTLKKLYEMKIIQKKGRIFINSKFIYLFYCLVLMMRKLYNIGVK
jgi:hypothetical protein